MNMNKKQLRTRQSGFTMIEIIAVLVILGILGAIAVPKYFGMQQKASIQAAKGAANKVIGRFEAAVSESALDNRGNPDVGDAVNNATYGQCNIGDTDGCEAYDGFIFTISTFSEDDIGKNCTNIVITEYDGVDEYGNGTDVNATWCIDT